MQEIAIGISSCLTGACVRYDGSCRYSPWIVDVLRERAELVPMCPEHECGMPVPREPMDLYESATGIRLRTVESGRDLTGMLESWMGPALKRIAVLGIKGFILKSGSPSCGVGTARIHRGGRVFTCATGIFAEALTRECPEVLLVEDTELHCPGRAVSFAERIGGSRHAQC